MMNTSYPPEPVQVECCHYDDDHGVMCNVPADYGTFYRHIYLTFCERHYHDYIVLPLMDGTLEPELVSRVAPGSEAAR